MKLQLKAGEASMAPPVGPAFGQRGLNGMDFVKQFNARTQKEEKGLILPVQITYYADKSFTFIIKSPPASVLLLRACKLKSGSPTSNKTKVATVTRSQCEEIVKMKMQDLNCHTVESGVEMIRGTARSMGILFKEG